MKRITRYTNPKVVAVTGGIGSGQSTVCKRLSELGCRIIDLDKKAKQIIQKDSVLQRELKKAFGNEIFTRDGTLNRKLLGRLAFSHESKTMELNKLVHPRMVADVVEEMETARFSEKYPLIVIDAALIFEISIEQMFDAVIVVYASKDNRVNRVMKRDDLKRTEILARMRRQIPLEDKKKWADHVIDNNGTIEELYKQTNQLFNTLVSDIKTSHRIRV
jgi:dephospho-CoA kinase